MWVMKHYHFGGRSWTGSFYRSWYSQPLGLRLLYWALVVLSIVLSGLSLAYSRTALSTPAYLTLASESSKPAASSAASPELTSTPDSDSRKRPSPSSASECSSALRAGQ